MVCETRDHSVVGKDLAGGIAAGQASDFNGVPSIMQFARTDAVAISNPGVASKSKRSPR